jgi:Ca2+-binding RTX toxin-like protein
VAKLGYLNFFAEHSFELALLGVDIRDMVAHEIDGEIYLYTSTSMEGGAVAYRLNADGIPELIDMQEYSGASRIPVLHGVNIVTLNGSDFLLVGSNDTHEMTGYRLADDGSIGRRHSVDWGPIDNGATHIEFITIAGRTFVATASENGAGLSVFEVTDDGATLSFELSGAAPDAVTTVASMDVITLGGTTYVLTASTEQNEVSTFRIDGSGALTLVDTFGAFDGLGISAPTGMEVVTIGANSYVILASSVSDSLSVLRLTDDGSLEAVDHVIDTLNTRFENIGEMDVFDVDGHIFVLASGTDNGLSLLTLLPNGRLQHLETLAWDGDNGLNSISAIEVVNVGGAIQVFVASGTGEGLFQFDFDTSDLGSTLIGTPAPETLSGTGRDDLIEGGSGNDVLRGNNGDDILVDGMGRDTFWGGAGADTFVMMPEDNSTDTVMDFERGVDVLDLSNFGMLYSVSQITVISTSYGARVTFRGETFEIHSIDGYSLNADDMFGGSFLGPDRPYLSVLNEVYGTEQADNLIGGTGTDIIYGYASNDRIEGGYGDDTIMGGDGEDTIMGGVGNDRINGGALSDYIDAGSGDDWVNGGRGPDTIYLGSGNDTFVDLLQYGDAGIDTVYGGAGDDTITAGGGNDILSGGSGRDTIFGGTGHDTISGDSGGDLLYGGLGSDTIHGGTGNDTINGGNQSDTIYAGAGNDIVIGGRGADTAYLGDGNDEYIDHLQFGAAGLDIVYGQGGDDLLRGRGGRDFLYGGPGNDDIYGGADNDYIHGGTGNDYINAATGHDYVLSGAGRDTVLLGAGNDRYFDQDHDGALDRDVVYGGRGADRIVLYGGNDMAYGGIGNDVISAGRGADWIDGGQQADRLTGGRGPDTFVFHNNDGRDVITDFTLGQDTLRLEISGLSYADLSFISTPNGTAVDYGTGRIILLDVDISDITTSSFHFL